jgi:hypothetical protein
VIERRVADKAQNRMISWESLAISATAIILLVVEFWPLREFVVDAFDPNRTQAEAYFLYDFLVSAETILMRVAKLAFAAVMVELLYRILDRLGYVRRPSRWLGHMVGPSGFPARLLAWLRAPAFKLDDHDEAQ